MRDISSCQGKNKRRLTGMRLDCDVIRDLMPLYMEKLASEKSCELVEEHIKECESCKRKLEEMREPKEKMIHNVEPLKEFRRKMKMHNRLLVTLTAFVTFSILTIVEGALNVTSETPERAMGFCLLYFYLLMPIISLFCSYQVARQYKKLCWGMPVLCGILALVLGRIVFWQFEIFFAWLAMVPSFVGVVIGSLLEWRRKKKCLKTN